MRSESTPRTGSCRRRRVPLGAALAGCVALAPRGTAATPAAPDPAAQAISFYQEYISSLRHARCPFEPSCSQYALESIHAHGVIAGSALAADRLMRCNASVRRFYARGDDGRFDVADLVAVPAGILPSLRRRERVGGCGHILRD